MPTRSRGGQPGVERSRPAATSPRCSRCVCHHPIPGAARSCRAPQPAALLARHWRRLAVFCQSPGAGAAAVENPRTGSATGLELRTISSDPLLYSLDQQTSRYEEQAAQLRQRHADPAQASVLADELEELRQTTLATLQVPVTQPGPGSGAAPGTTPQCRDRFPPALLAGDIVGVRPAPS